MNLFQEMSSKSVTTAIFDTLFLSGNGYKTATLGDVDYVDIS